MTEPLPIVEGRRDKPNDVEERVERQELLQQAAEMDAPRVLPTDELREYSDIEKKESQDQILEKATEINKRVISDKQRATLERARQAKAEKKRRMESDNSGSNHNAAQGTPVPDYLVDAIKTLQENQEKYFARMTDLLQLQAYEAPLQQQHIVKTSVPQPVKPPNDPQSVQMMPKREMGELENPSLLQVRDMPRPSRMQDEANAFKRKFQKAFENNEYYTEEVTKRAHVNPTTSGMKPGQETNIYADIFW
jgi:hypothetical protein